MAGQGRHQTLPQRTVGRRSLVLGGVAAAGTAVLAGGGGSLAAPAPARRASSAARAAQDVTEIEFWHGFAAHEIAALQDMLDQRFAPTHPTIKVNAVGGADAAKILAAISGGNPPDVVLLPSPDAIGTWAHNGALQPLDDHIKTAGVDLGAFVPTGLEQCKLGDAYFALPFVNFNRALYWNKDLFKAAGLDPEVPPKTIDEMLSFAEKLTKKDGDSIAQIGVWPVMFAAVFWMYWIGDTAWATFLLVWSIPVVIIDNFIRPILIKRGADMPLLLIFVGVIGGLLGFGLVGIFVGPVVLSVAYTLLNAWMAEDPEGTGSAVP